MYTFLRIHPENMLYPNHVIMEGYKEVCEYLELPFHISSKKHVLNMLQKHQNVGVLIPFQNKVFRRNTKNVLELLFSFLLYSYPNVMAVVTVKTSTWKAVHTHIQTHTEV